MRFKSFEQGKYVCATRVPALGVLQSVLKGFGDDRQDGGVHGCRIRGNGTGLDKCGECWEKNVKTRGLFGGFPDLVGEVGQTGDEGRKKGFEEI